MRLGGNLFLSSEKADQDAPKSSSRRDIPRGMTLRVLLQSWAESRDDPVSHFLMAAACRRSQDVSKTRLTITASGLGCP